MAYKPWQFSVVSAFFGMLSFLLGVIAENKKPAAGIPLGKDVVVCKFPIDPVVPLGFLSTVSLIFCGLIGVYSIFYSYEGKQVPRAALFESTTLRVFFCLAMIQTVAGGAGLLWTTLTELLHRVNNVHHTVGYTCPTAKTGLFGGAALLALNSAGFWGICLMLTANSREDYLAEDSKGAYGEVLATDFQGKRPKV